MFQTEAVMSTTWYAKVDCNIHTNRKVMKAGRIGREVWFFVLCMNAQRGALGEFPAEDLEPWYVASQLQMTEAEAEQGIAACVSAELIEFKDGLVVMCGWDVEYGKYPLGNTERQKQFRERRKMKKQSAEQQSNVVGNTNNDGCDTSVTERPLRSNDATVTVSRPSNETSRPVTQEGRKEGREGGRETRSQETEQCQTGAAKSEFDPEDPDQRRRLIDRVWLELGKIRQHVAQELGLPRPAPMQPITPSTYPQSASELRQRIIEEGRNAPAICRYVLESATAQARSDRSLTFLGERLFLAGPWRTARERTPTWRDQVRYGQGSANVGHVSEVDLSDGSTIRVTYARNGDEISREVIKPAASEAVA